jgi:hypothetical protein
MQVFGEFAVSPMHTAKADFLSAKHICREKLSTKAS